MHTDRFVRAGSSCSILVCDARGARHTVRVTQRGWGVAKVMPPTSTVRMPPAHAVERPHLRDRLDAALGAPLTLLVAPAGSGKTVLLTQWAAVRADLQFVWVDVEPSDDDPTRFAAKLLGQVSVLSPSALELGPLQRIGGAGLGIPLLESLSALLSEHPGTVVVFDDLHVLTNESLLTDLWWLADHLPAAAHLVFSSRGERRLALSRHRLRHGLLELRHAELAFDRTVAAEVLRRIAGDAIEEPTVATVLDTTEGWAAGVQLTAISLRNHGDPESFARGLAGTDRLISDFLSEEVLAAQSDDRRALLLRLSALDRMSAPLVESVLRIPDAAALFVELERDAMFMVAVDQHQEWFRFHHLFRDLLRYRLRAAYPHDESRIVGAAADWFLQQGDFSSAVECLLRVRRWDRAMDLILRGGREVFERGQVASVAQWLACIPESERIARPHADLLYGIVLGQSGQSERSEEVFRRLIARPGIEPGFALVAHAYLAARVQFSPPVSVSIDAGEGSLRMLEAHPEATPPDILGLTHRTFLETLTLGSLARAHLLGGDLDGARKEMRAAMESRGAHYSAYEVHLLGTQALLEAWSGRLKIAQGLADEALQLAREVGLLVHPAPADAYLALSLVAIHQSRPYEASFARHEGAERAASNRRTQLMWVADLQMILAGEADSPAVESRIAAPPIVRDALEAASRRSRRLAGGAGMPTTTARTWSAVFVENVTAALTDGRLAEARELLDSVTFEYREVRPLASVEHGILTAWLAHAEGRPAESRGQLTMALDLAAEHGIVSAFVWAGPALMTLIESLPEPSSSFRRHVLDCAREHHRPPPNQALSEPLTDRERELLALLPTRLTNAELAGRLFVTIHTIKTHVAHIYRKLDAPNRSAAVRRAAELGLL